MVTAREVDGGRGGHFEEEEGKYDLDAETAAVDKVSVEEVGVGGGWIAVDGEDVEYVVELAVCVAADCYAWFV